MRQAVEAVGGTVDREFQNLNAIAATVPTGTLAALGAMPDFKVTKDELVAPPTPRDPAGEGSGVAEYPTNDLDMYVVDPAGAENANGAQINSPERATLVSPAPGEYAVRVNGFTVFGPLGDDHESGSRASKTDRFTLRVYLE